MKRYNLKPEQPKPVAVYEFDTKDEMIDHFGWYFSEAWINMFDPESDYVVEMKVGERVRSFEMIRKYILEGRIER